MLRYLKHVRISKDRKDMARCSVGVKWRTLVIVLHFFVCSSYRSQRLKAPLMEAGHKWCRLTFAWPVPGRTCVSEQKREDWTGLTASLAAVVTLKLTMVTYVSVTHSDQRVTKSLGRSREKWRKHHPRGHYFFLSICGFWLVFFLSTFHGDCSIMKYSYCSHPMSPYKLL